jgi:proteasome assembly chaperone (PAC2) family protein
MNDLSDLSSYLEWRSVPQMKSPFMVVGFHGWSDAGCVSSDTLTYLKEAFAPDVFATFSNGPFVHYTLDRPLGRIEDGLVRYVEPMESEFACWSDPEGKHDAIFLLGREPSLDWRLYTRVIFEIIERLRVRTLYTIGGVQDAVSHSMPPFVSVVASSRSVMDLILEPDQGIRPADYQGPVSIHSYLIRMCTDNGIDGLSLWGHVPAYLQRNPRMTARMVTILCGVTGIECPVEPLVRKSIEMDRQINEALARDQHLRQFVESISDNKGSQSPKTGSDKIIRLDDFLRRYPNKDPQP